MKLFLALLALLTGFAGSDVARQAPASPATLGAALAVVEAAAETHGAPHVYRAGSEWSGPLLLLPVPALAAFAVQLVQPGLAPRGQRARE